MDSSLEVAGADPSKCSKMSIDEKRQLVYELSKQSHLASELLQTWSRQEILQILCAEMGKERKYTGLTKVKIIETLLRIVSEKNSGVEERKTDSSPSQRNSKRQRKADNPSHVVVPTRNASGTCDSVDTTGENAIHCKNSACRAVLKQEDKFCRRCSCCICHKYDDNKDPSLWLTCSSDPPFANDSCGLSCHLECAFKHEKSGLGKDKRNTAPDGCFYCVSCGKTNDLLECWKKQLTIAKETRRVDVLCHRLFLARKLLKGMPKFQNLSEIVDKAVKSLEDEVGPLTGHPMKMGRGIVNRLHSGPDVQKLCISALESLEKILSEAALHSSQGSKMQDTTNTGSTKIRFEEVRATSLTVVLGVSESSSPANIVHYSIWHRKVTEKEYPKKSTCTLFTPNTRFVVSGLAPASEYCFKVVSFSGTRELNADEINVSTLTAEEEEEEAVNCSSVVERSESPQTNCSSLSAPSSVEAESNNDYISYGKKTEAKNIFPQNLSNNGDSPSIEDNTVKRVIMEPDSDVIQIERNNSSEEQMEELNEVVPDNRPETPVLVAADLVGNRNASDTSLPITPFRSDQIKNRQGRAVKSKGDNNHANMENASTSKQKGDATNGEHSANGGSDSSFEHCVKIIRQLECSGHIEKSFRQKFLTWYSLRARPQEIRVVKIFVDTFMDDPSALAEQIVDTFSDCVSSKRSAFGDSSAVVPSGFCMKLWH